MSTWILVSIGGGGADGGGGGGVSDGVVLRGAVSIGELTGAGLVIDPLFAGWSSGTGEGLPDDVAAQPLRIAIATTQGRTRTRTDRWVIEITFHVRRVDSVCP